jgi:CubicO group peptidase (beta-lactamase class C family)
MGFQALDLASVKGAGIRANFWLSSRFRLSSFRPGDSLAMRSLSRFATAILLPFLSSTVVAEDVKIVETVQPFVDRGNLAGAVMLVASPDKVLSLEAVGYSDVGSRIPLKTDALFWIASMNKPITSTALMLLVDEGKVKLDDPVEKYLPEFKNQLRFVEKRGDEIILKKPAKPITVRNILSHTAGLVDRSPLEGKLDSISLKDGAISYGLSPLISEPGTKYKYCNPGINTAGRIIEVVSGIPYEKFLQERLFDPLAMKDTTFWPTEDQAKRLAKSYKPGPNKKGLEETEITQLTYPLTDRKRHPYPAGGLFSTAEDLGTFCRMILSGGQLDGKRYLSEKAIREMTSTQTGDLINGGKGEGGYGLGWNTSNMSKGENGPVIPGPCGHGGAYATNMGIDPGKKLVTVWLVQHAGFPGDGDKAQGAFHSAAVKIYGK